MDEEFESFVVTDPDLVDEGIDVSGLRTKTDTSLLGNIPGLQGVQYEAFNPNRLSDLIRFFETGLPAVDTPVDVTTPVTPVTGVGGGADSGDGGQATIPDVDLGDNTQFEQDLIDEGIGLQIAPGQPIFAPGEMPVTQAEMDAENFPELTEQMSEVSIPTPPPFEMPRGGGADIDTFDTTPQTGFLPSGAAGGASLENLDLDNIDLGNPTGDSRIVSEEQETQGAPSIVDPIMDPNLMEIRQQQNTITPEDTEESITQKIASFLNVDADKLNKAAVTSALNLVAGEALGTAIPIATVFNLVKDSFTKSPEEIQAEQAAARQNIEENKVLSEVLEEEVTPQDTIDDRGRGQIPTRTEPEPTPVDRPTMADIAGPSGDRDDSPAPSASVSTAGQAGPPSQRGGGADMGAVSTPTGISSAFSSYSAAPASVGGGDTGGGGGRDSGSSKIVCTMMNESYGFGSFRNKIWLKHSKDLAPEYQKGYHKIFLPLVRLSKNNKILKKMLEHIAVHRTIDIRQESRGKVHLLGRVYRKILEPICYWVGKYAK
jgi:hypothetical protein